jgi:hypothetical protein
MRSQVTCHLLSDAVFVQFARGTSKEESHAHVALSWLRTVVYRPRTFSSSSASAYLVFSSLLPPSLSSNYPIIQSSLGRITESSRDRPAVRHWDLTSSGRTLLYFRQKGGCGVYEALPTENPESCHCRSICNLARAVVRTCVSLSLQGFSEQYRHLSPPGRILAHQANVAFYYRGSQVHQRPR